MRFTLSLALSALALVSSTFANDVSPVDSHLEARDEVPTLMKRTGNHNTYTCSSSKHKLCWNKGNNSCDCKADFKRTNKNDWNICDGPKTHGTGDAVCGHGGCNIECHAGMVYDKRSKDCVCQDKYELHRTGSYCVPQCKGNQELIGGVCLPVCKGDLIRNFLTKDCECPAGFELSKQRTNNNNKCVPIPPKCKPTEQLISGVCYPKCESSFILNKVLKVCECPIGFEPSRERTNGPRKCVPKCKSTEQFLSGQCFPKCEDSFILNKVLKICECPAGFEPSRERTLGHKKCVPKPPVVCKGDYILNKILKICECPAGTEPSKERTFNHKCVPVHECKKYEIWNGKECVCKPGCWKHPSKNECVPGASQLPHVPGTGNGGNHGGHGHGHGHGWWKRDEAPVWSSKLHQRHQDALFCPDGLSACPIPATLGGYECVDVKTELEQCGGCLADGAGQDCTQIAGVSGVGCQAGKCVVFSCDDHHQLTAAGECTPSLTKRSA